MIDKHAGSRYSTGITCLARCHERDPAFGVYCCWRESTSKETTFRAVCFRCRTAVGPESPIPLLEQPHRSMTLDAFSNTDQHVRLAALLAEAEILAVLRQGAAVHSTDYVDRITVHLLHSSSTALEASNSSVLSSSCCSACSSPLPWIASNLQSTRRCVHSRAPRERLLSCGAEGCTLASHCLARFLCCEVETVRNRPSAASSRCHAAHVR